MKSSMSSLHHGLDYEETLQEFWLRSICGQVELAFRLLGSSLVPCVRKSRSLNSRHCPLARLEVRVGAVVTVAGLLTAIAKAHSCLLPQYEEHGFKNASQDSKWYVL
jgi:hypothetical protein